MLALFQFQNNAKVLDPWNTAGIQIKILRFLAAVFQVLSVVCLKKLYMVILLIIIYIISL